MKSNRAILATFLFFPLALFAQHGGTPSSGGSVNSSSDGGHSSPSSSSGSSAPSHSSAPSGSSTHGSSGSGGSRTASNSHSGSTQRSSTAQHQQPEAGVPTRVQDKNAVNQSKDSKADKRVDHGAGKEHTKRSWIPWKRHSDKLAKKDNHEDKKQKCRAGKPCKNETKLAQSKPPKPPVCKPGKPCMCPTGTTANKKGVCTTIDKVPDSYSDCLGGPVAAGQAAGRPCSTVQNNCSALALQLQREQVELQTIQNARTSACAQSPASQECMNLNNQYQSEVLRMEELRREYEACQRR